MKSLRARLFAATLAALALTLALTIGIGVVLTRRQLDQTQAQSLARSADAFSLQRHRDVSYKNQNQLSGGRQGDRAATGRPRSVRAERQPVEQRQDDV